MVNVDGVEAPLKMSTLALRLSDRSLTSSSSGRSPFRLAFFSTLQVLPTPGYTVMP
jgi:hypothetical protein